MGEHPRLYLRYSMACTKLCAKLWQIASTLLRSKSPGPSLIQLSCPQAPQMPPPLSALLLKQWRALSAKAQDVTSDVPLRGRNVREIGANILYDSMEWDPSEPARPTLQPLLSRPLAPRKDEMCAQLGQISKIILHLYVVIPPLSPQNRHHTPLSMSTSLLLTIHLPSLTGSEMYALSGQNP